MMTYQRYIGSVGYDDQTKLFHGDVINTRDGSTFQGTSEAELERTFHESVDDYVLWCEEEGLPPAMPHSAKFKLRLSLEPHREFPDPNQRRMAVRSCGRTCRFRLEVDGPTIEEETDS